MQTIASAKDFQSFFTSLNTEICRVWEHWNVLKGVHAAFKDYSREMNESDQFWRIASRALQDIVIVRLAALLDPREDVVSMPNFLRLLRQEAVLERPVLPVTQKRLRALNIEKDINAVHRDAEVPTKVRRLRNKIIAHRDMSIVLREAVDELPELPDTQIDELIKNLHSMVGKYSRMIGVNLILLNFPGSDDYKGLFKVLRLGFETLTEQYQRRRLP